MLLDAIITVLRETLEAGVLISLLVSQGKIRRIRGYWVLIGLVLGLSGAVLYAINMRALSEAFDYSGQEVVNASMQYAIYGCLLLLLLVHSWLRAQYVIAIMVSVVALVVVREGAEIMIFFTALLNHEGMVLKVFLSGFVGLAIGVSVGILCYYCLNLLPLAWRKVAQIILLAMISAGMVAQATQLLIQIDWISAGHAVWDSGGWLSESSVVGQVAYAVFGYEASPSLIEVVLYAASLAVALVLGLLVYSSRSGRHQAKV